MEERKRAIIFSTEKFLQPLHNPANVYGSALVQDTHRHTPVGEFASAPLLQSPALPPSLQGCCCHPLCPLQPPPHDLGRVLGYRNILATFMAACTACCLESSLSLYFQYDEKTITFIPLKTEMFSFLKSYKEFCWTQLPFLFFLLP